MKPTTVKVASHESLGLTTPAFSMLWISENAPSQQLGEWRRPLSLQRRSKQLTRNTVSAILKETSCVSGDNRIERFAYSFHQRFPTPSLRLTEKTFNLRESLFDGTEVR